MSNLTLKDLFDTLKEWHSEQLIFIEKYSEHIEVLKNATIAANVYKKSWLNSHKWLIILFASLLIIFGTPLVMRANNICQVNIKFNDNIGFQRCK